MKAVLMKTVDAAKALVSKVSGTQDSSYSLPRYMINAANGLCDSRLFIQSLVMFYIPEVLGPSKQLTTDVVLYYYCLYTVYPRWLSETSRS